MEAKINGGSAFAHIEVELAPGEEVLTESGAMASMDGQIELRSSPRGGIFKALIRKFFGKESFFMNTFKNLGDQAKKIVVTQNVPGDIRCLELQGNAYYIQPSAFVCCSAGVEFDLKWAGFVSWIAGEGLFRIQVSGNGKCFIGCFGTMLDKKVGGEYLVDTGHLVAYEPSIKLKLQLAGGIFSSLFGGEGFVTRLEGNGNVIMQSRSLDGMAGWLNPRI